MRISTILLLFAWLSLSGHAQVLVKGVVKDSKSQTLLPYCNIMLKGTRVGTMTNLDGEFSLEVVSVKDTLLLSFLGYNPRAIVAESIQHAPLVYMVPINIMLQEVLVHADNDYLYDMLVKCRKRLIKCQAMNNSRVYFGLQTRTMEKPLELMECYFNANLEGVNIKELMFKNGRTALAETFNNYFISENTSKAISMMKLTEDEGFFPSLPLQYNKKEMKRNFNIERVDVSDDMNHLKFYPFKDPDRHFSGEVWLDKKNGDLLKICLNSQNTFIHPFLPLFSEDSLSNVSLTISNSYKWDETNVFPDYFRFKYSFTYNCKRDTPVAAVKRIVSREMATTGVMIFYDYGNPFILPWFQYNNDYDDYRKMSIIPYNTFFWDNNNKLLLTGQQKEDLNFLAREGLLINFREGNFGTEFIHLPGFGTHSLFEYNYTFWSHDKRILLSRKYFNNEVYSKEKINQSIQRDLYNLKVQILLDVNQSGDSINFCSYTVFDPDQSFYHLPELQWTNAFLNIYFDICEIERRKLDLLLMKQHSGLSIIDSLYKASLERMNRITETYLKEAQQGINEKQLGKWNDYVRGILGIDNLRMFGKAKEIEKNF